MASPYALAWGTGGNTGGPAPVALPEAPVGSSPYASAWGSATPQSAALAPIAAATGALGSEYAKVWGTGDVGGQNAANAAVTSKGHNNVLTNIFHAIDAPRAAVLATGRQLEHVATGGSWNQQQLHSDAVNHTGVADLLKSAGMPGGWQDKALGFLGDVATDPITYLTLGSGDAAEMGAKGIAEQIAKGADEGGSALTNESLANFLAKGTAGLNPAEKAALAERGTQAGGAYLRVPLTKLAEHLGIGEAKYIPILPSEATDLVTGPARQMYNALSDTKVGQAITGALTKTGGIRAAMREAAMGGDAAGTRDAWNVLQAAPKLKASANAFVVEHAPGLVDSLKNFDPAIHADDLRNALEHAPDTAEHATALEGLARNGIENPADAVGGVRQWLNTVKDAAGSHGVDLSHFEDYFPHQLTEAARDAGGRAGSAGKIAAEFARTLRPGEKFMGETLEHGTVDEINSIGKAKLGDGWTDMFKGNPHEVLPKYLQSVGRRVGQGDFLQALKDTGTVSDKWTTEQVLQKGASLAKHDAISAKLGTAQQMYEAAAKRGQGLYSKIQDLASTGEAAKAQDLFRQASAEGPARDALQTELDARQAFAPEVDPSFQGAVDTNAAAGAKGADMQAAGVTGFGPAREGDIGQLIAQGAEKRAPELQAALDAHVAQVAPDIAANNDRIAELNHVLEHGSPKDIANATREKGLLDEANLAAKRYASASDQHERAYNALVSKAATTEARMDQAGAKINDLTLRSQLMNSPKYRDALVDATKPGNAELTGTLASLSDKAQQAPSWMNEALDQLTAIQKPSGINNFLKKYYDPQLRLWKAYSLMTPGKALRHQFGAMFNMFLANTLLHNTSDAFSILKDYHGGGLEALDEGDRAVVQAALDNHVFHNSQFTEDEQKLLGSTTKRTVTAGRLNPLNPDNVALKFNRDLQTRAQDYIRFSVFHDAMAKGATAGEAADKVRTFLFDWGDHTNFEQNVLKRLIPFYTFTRQNVPLMLHQMALQPGKFTTFYHLAQNIEKGVTPDALEPQFFKDAMAVHLPFKSGGNSTYLRPDLPFARLGETLNGVNSLLHGNPDWLMSQVTPLIKTPIEEWAGKSFYTNAKFAGTDASTGPHVQAAPGTWTKIPGLMEALQAGGIAHRAVQPFVGTNKATIGAGQWAMTPAAIYGLESLVPGLGQLRRTLPTEPNMMSRGGTNKLAYFLGQNFSTNDPTQQAGDIWNKYDTLQRIYNSLQDRGLAPQKKYPTP